MLPSAVFALKVTSGHHTPATHVKFEHSTSLQPMASWWCQAAWAAYCSALTELMQTGNPSRALRGASHWRALCDRPYRRVPTTAPAASPAATSAASCAATSAASWSSAAAAAPTQASAPCGCNVPLCASWQPPMPFGPHGKDINIFQYHCKAILPEPKVEVLIGDLHCRVFRQKCRASGNTHAYMSVCYMASNQIPGYLCLRMLDVTSTIMLM